MIDDMTVAEIRDEVSEIESAEELESLLNAEERGKDRKTAKEAIEERLDTVNEERLDDLSDDLPEDDADEEPDPEQGDLIHVRPPRTGGHIAGYSFGDNEVKQIPLNAKVKRALSKGKLQIVKR